MSEFLTDLMFGGEAIWNLLWIMMLPIMILLTLVSVGWEKFKNRPTAAQRRAADARAIVDELERREQEHDARAAVAARGAASLAAHAALEEELSQLTEQWQDSAASEHDEPLFTKRWEQE